MLKNPEFMSTFNCCFCTSAFLEAQMIVLSKTKLNLFLSIAHYFLAHDSEGAENVASVSCFVDFLTLACLVVVGDTCKFGASLYLVSVPLVVVVSDFPFSITFLMLTSATATFSFFTYERIWHENVSCNAIINVSYI